VLEAPEGTVESFNNESTSSCRPDWLDSKFSGFAPTSSMHFQF